MEAIVSGYEVSSDDDEDLSSGEKSSPKKCFSTNKPKPIESSSDEESQAKPIIPDDFLKSHGLYEAADSTDSENEAKTLDEKVAVRKKKAKAVKTDGEIDISQLPPVEPVDFSVPSNAIMSKFGVVKAIVDEFVTVQADLKVPALDEGSVLFLSHRNVLGRVYDVFGRVDSACYVVRFNSCDEIVKLAIAVGESVFYAPNVEQFTNFVFVKDLKKLTFTDASGVGDNEAPPELVEFSDDEEEVKMKKQSANVVKRKGRGKRY